MGLEFLVDLFGLEFARFRESSATSVVVTGLFTSVAGSVVSVGIAASGVELDVGSFGGRPLFGLVAITVSSRRYATLISETCLNSRRSSPCLFVPTLISIVDLDGLEVTGKGPLNFGISPFMSYCLT